MQSGRFFPSFAPENSNSNENSFFRNFTDRLFDAHTQEAIRRSQEESQNVQSTGPPPASSAFINQLPRVKVCREDLFDPANRVCSVCLEPNKLYDTNVIRLPCAHMFHADCITSWLQRHCTCPVCRYELPAENEVFEAGRRERMAERRPRFTRTQLESLSISQLKAILGDRPCQAADKHDLVTYVIESDAIDFLDDDRLAPPSQFHRSALRSMSVGVLKSNMHEAGVFFDSNEVVEKNDLITIWEQSGRLQILPEHEVDEDDDDNENEDFGESNNDEPYGSVEVESGSTHRLSHGRSEPRSVDSGGFVVVETVVSSNSRGTAEPLADERQDPTQLMEENATFHEATAKSDERHEAEDYFSLSSQSENMDDDARFESASSNNYERTTIVEEVEVIPAEVISGTRFDNYSSSELRRQANAMSVDISDCLERQDVVAALATAENAHLEEWDEWRESEIRAVASIIKVDLSNCRNRAAMMKALVLASQEDLRVGSYLRAIAPLARMKSQELRALARDWQVRVSDCLEKGDILKRLAQAGGPTAQFESSG